MQFSQRLESLYMIKTEDARDGMFKFICSFVFHTNFIKVFSYMYLVFNIIYRVYGYERVYLPLLYPKGRVMRGPCIFLTGNQNGSFLIDGPHGR